MSAEESYRSVAGIVVIRDPLDVISKSPSDNNVHSLERKSNEKLYLLVKKPRDDHAWQFPQGGIKQKKKETISEGALRELAEECSQDIKVELIDKEEPFCVYQYLFPDDFIKKKAKKRNYIGAKVQFIRSKWISGQCQPDGKEIIDFAWLTKEEVGDYVSLDYGNGIKPIFE